MSTGVLIVELAGSRRLPGKTDLLISELDTQPWHQRLPNGYIFRFPPCAHLTCSRARRQAPKNEAFSARAMHSHRLQTNAFALIIPNRNRKGTHPAQNPFSYIAFRDIASGFSIVCAVSAWITNRRPDGNGFRKSGRLELSYKSQWLPYAGLIAAMVLWASSFVALKLAFRSYHPMVVIFGRMMVASLCFLLFTGRFRGVRFRKGDWKSILFMTICEPCLYFIFEAAALENTTASQAGMIAAMLPLMVAVAARWVLKERLSRRTYLGFAIAICGAVWLSSAGKAHAAAPNPILGNFLEFVAMICATGYIITLKQLTDRYSPFLLTAFQAFIGSLFYFPLLFLPSTALPTRWEPTGIMAIGYLGAFISFGAYGLYNFGVSRISVSRASAFVNLIPVFTLFFGWAILGERFAAVQYLAAGMIFTGIYVSQVTTADRSCRAVVKQTAPSFRDVEMPAGQLPMEGRKLQLEPLQGGGQEAAASNAGHRLPEGSS
jgi:drug/metabolite transporter (DMT)-like permease